MLYVIYDVYVLYDQTTRLQPAFETISNVVTDYDRRTGLVVFQSKSPVKKSSMSEFSVFVTTPTTCSLDVPLVAVTDSFLLLLPQ